jgi:hypothetical protein
VPNLWPRTIRHFWEGHRVRERLEATEIFNLIAIKGYKISGWPAVAMDKLSASKTLLKIGLILKA